MDNWLPAAAAADIPPGTCRELVLGDRLIALFNAGGEFYALDGVCPHQGGPLGKGSLRGHIVTCPWHGWQFDIRNGQHQISPLIRQPSLPVKLENGQVLINLGQ
jgi:nitrite reductase (NADH) small subunit